MKKKYIIPETLYSENIIISNICGTSPSVTGDGTDENPPGWGGYDDGTHDPDAKFRDEFEEEIFRQMELDAKSANGLW